MKLRDPFSSHDLWFSPLEEKWLHLVRSWRNEPRCRLQFHDSSVIDHERQQVWFKDIYLPNPDSDAVWVFGDTRVGVVGQVALYGADAAHGVVTFGRLMVGREDMLGKGYGEKATRGAVERAWALGFRRVELDVKATNVGAVRLYERCGFLETRRTDDTIYMAVVSSEPTAC